VILEVDWMRFVILEVDMNEICEIGSRYESLYISTLCGGHWRIRNKLLKQIVCEIMGTG